MQLWEVRGVLEAEVLWEPVDLTMEIDQVAAADLMSDVLNLSPGGELLITGLTNVQAVLTAEMAEIKALVFCRGKRPDDEVIAVAKKKDIPLLVTRLYMYEACARLAMRGLPGTSGIIW
jgi:predicted transcriptional regulator